MTDMRALKTDLLRWKPEVDHHVHELEHAVLDLGECIEQVRGSRVPQAYPLDPPGNEHFVDVTITQPPLTKAIREDHFASPSNKAPSSAHLVLSPQRAAPGLLDHRGADFGAVYTIAP
jgi:hypothetical protein